MKFALVALLGASAFAVELDWESKPVYFSYTEKLPQGWKPPTNEKFYEGDEKTNYNYSPKYGHQPHKGPVAYGTGDYYGPEHGEHLNAAPTYGKDHRKGPVSYGRSTQVTPETPGKANKTVLYGDLAKAAKKKGAYGHGNVVHKPNAYAPGADDVYKYGVGGIVAAHRPASAYKPVARGYGGYGGYGKNAGYGGYGKNAGYGGYGGYGGRGGYGKAAGYGGYGGYGNNAGYGGYGKSAGYGGYGGYGGNKGYGNSYGGYGGNKGYGGY